MYSVKETQEMVSFIARLISAGDKALADGKVNVLDGYLLLDPIRVAPAAWQGIQLIPAELSDLDDSEQVLISETVEQELELRNEFAKEIAVDLTEIGGKLAVVLAKIKAHKAETQEEEMV